MSRETREEDARSARRASTDVGRVDGVVASLDLALGRPFRRIFSKAKKLETHVRSRGRRPRGNPRHNEARVSPRFSPPRGPVPVPLENLPARSARALQGSPPLVVAPSAMLLTLAPRVTPVRAPTGVGRLRPARAGLVSARAYPRRRARASSRAPATPIDPSTPRPTSPPRASSPCSSPLSPRSPPRPPPRPTPPPSRSGAEPIGLSSSWRRRSRSSAPPPRASPPARSASSSPRSTRSSAR